jgi:hypothetical protein
MDHNIGVQKKQNITFRLRYPSVSSAGRSDWDAMLAYHDSAKSCRQLSRSITGSIVDNDQLIRGSR